MENKPLCCKQKLFSRSALNKHATVIELQCVLLAVDRMRYVPYTCCFSGTLQIGGIKSCGCSGASAPTVVGLPNLFFDESAT